MEANKILTADVLDIIFEGRNKEYGAYNLRKTYNRRILKSLGFMLGGVGMLIGGYVLASNVKPEFVKTYKIDDPHLTEVIVDPIKPPPPPPPPPKPVQLAIETKRFTEFLIAPDKDVDPKDAPPENKDLDNVRIGNFDKEGNKEDDIVAPPVSDSRGVVSAPKDQVPETEKIFTVVEIESSYPGGAGAWMRYLNKTFVYPEEAQSTEKQGTVVVQFIVDQEGNVSNVEAISGPDNGGLREEAIRVIRKSGKWEPAIQNGRKVKSYKKQPIIFRLNTE